MEKKQLSARRFKQLRKQIERANRAPLPVEKEFYPFKTILFGCIVLLARTRPEMRRLIAEATLEHAQS